MPDLDAVCRLLFCLFASSLVPRRTPPRPTPPLTSPLHAASAGSAKATLSQNTVKSAKCRAPGVNANQMHGPLCAICVCHFCSVPKSTVLCLSYAAAFISSAHSSDRCANAAADVSSVRVRPPILLFSFPHFLLLFYMNALNVIAFDKHLNSVSVSHLRPQSVR